MELNTPQYYYFSVVVVAVLEPCHFHHHKSVNNQKIESVQWILHLRRVLILPCCLKWVDSEMLGVPDLPDQTKAMVQYCMKGVWIDLENCNSLLEDDVVVETTLAAVAAAVVVDDDDVNEAVMVPLRPVLHPANLHATKRIDYYHCYSY